jgi:hypothetical protein
MIPENVMPPRAMLALSWLRRDLGSLWVAGLVLLQLSLADRWLPLRGEPYEWAQFLLLGALPAALLLVLPLGRRLHPRVGPLVPLVQLALAAICPLFVLVHAEPGALGVPLALGLLQTALVADLAPRTLTAARTAGPAGPAARALALSLFAALSWTAVLSYLHWQPAAEWLGGSPTTLAVFGGCLALVLVNVFGMDPAAAAARPAWRRVAEVPGLAVLALVSFRMQDFNYQALHHWAVLVGPAELVRQGGWPLWDVPCQYGFLNTLLVAGLPFRSAWQSFYVVNAVLLWAAAAFLFLLLRCLRPGVLNYLFALGVSLAAVLLIPGHPGLLIGPFLVPAVGPFRFFWCYALLAVLGAEFQTAPHSRRRPALLGLGCLLWLVGCLWSSESAVYSSVIWLPAYAVLSWRHVAAQRPDQPLRRRLPALAAWLLLPAGLGTTTAGAVTAWYLRRLGHAPDWRGYWEYCLSFQGGYAALPIRPDGPVWSLVLVFVALATVAVEIVRRGRGLRGLGLVAGALGAVWATSSYYVGRSHDVNTTNLTPIFCLGAAVALLLLARLRSAGRVAALVQTSLVPFLTLVLAVPFTNESSLRRVWGECRKGYTRHVDRWRPVMDGALLDGWRQAGVRPGDPIAFLDLLPLPPRAAGGRRIEAGYPAWLPTVPFPLLMPLPGDRCRVYMERFTARAPRSGWVVLAKRPDLALPPWFMEQLARTHRPVRTVENSDWQLTWYELKQGLLAADSSDAHPTE